MNKPSARRKGGRSKPTIYDVAERAEMSISTVSRVMNGSDRVAKATRERVLAAMNELQFRPSRTAKSLAQPSARMIAVALPTFTTPFHSELLKGVRSRLKEVDIELLLCDLKWAEPEATLMNFLNRGVMDGLLMAGLPVDDAIGRELMKLGGPVVLIGNRWDPLDSFYWNETAGARLATRHLIDRGHRHVGMIAPSVESRLRNARIQGYKYALEEAGLAYAEEPIAMGRTEKHAGFSEESGYEAMENLLEIQPRVTAVFASSDVQAIGAWQAIRQRGLRVPDDIALIGYDDIKVSRFIGLSTVAQSMGKVGEEATDLLLRRLEGEKEPESISRPISHELKTRRSS